MKLFRRTLILSGSVCGLLGFISYAMAEAPKPATAQAKPPVVIEVKPACYTLAQYKAEQAIRYHSKLMVAGMLCQSHNPKSYSDYQAFTQRNQKTISRAENILIAYFTAQKRKQPEREFHTLRTNVANEISMKAMQQSLPAFCQNAVPALQQAASWQARQFDAYLVKMDMKQISTVKPCEQPVRPIPVSTKQPVSAAVKPVVPAKTVVKTTTTTTKTTVIPSQPQKK